VKISKENLYFSYKESLIEVIVVVGILIKKQIEKKTEGVLF
jgi:hypothetical protein